MAQNWDKPFELIIADEDSKLAHALAGSLRPHGFRVQVARSISQAPSMTAEEGLDFLVAGYPDPQRLDINQIKFTLRSMPGLTLIVLLPPGMEPYEELLTQSGASLVLCRELPPRQLAQIFVTLGDLHYTEAQNFRLRQMLDGRSSYGNLLGTSAPMRALYRLLDQVARTDAPVMILGEEGTERVDVARAIHAKSERALHPLIAVDCMARANDEQGVSILGPLGADEYATGPDPHRSVFARAGAGVVVLHKVECLGKTAQRRLLDFLYHPFFQNESAGGPSHPLARLIVTGNMDLAHRANDGSFLRELYYRLSILQVRVPALRERREDIPMLAQHLLRMAAKRTNAANLPTGFSSGALLAMFQYEWPGNLEELAELIHSAVEHGKTGEIELNDLPEIMRPESDPNAAAMPLIAALADLALKDAKRVFETEYFMGLLKKTRGNMTLASRYSRVGRPYLYKKIKEYGIEPDEFR